MVLCWEDLPVFVNEILRALFLTSLLHGKKEKMSTVLGLRTV